MMQTLETCSKEEMTRRSEYSSIALDIHGVIDQDPEFFSFLTKRLHSKNWKIHIVTGGRLKHNEQKLSNWGIYYDHFFSITDYHEWKGTPIIPGVCDGEICIEDKLWNSTKGQYCRAHAVDIIVDDSYIYKKYMPNETEFVWWSSLDVERNLINL